MEVSTESVHLRQKSLILYVERGEVTWSPCDILADNHLLSVQSARSRRQSQRRTWQRTNPDLPRLTSTTRYLVVPLVLPPTSYSDNQDLERNICDAVQPTGLDPLMVRFLDHSSRSVQTSGVDVPVGWVGWSPKAPTLRSAYQGPSHLRRVTSAAAEHVGGDSFLRHLVGTPVPTTTGWGFRVRSSDSSPPLSPSFTPPPSESPTPPSPSGPMPRKSSPSALPGPLLIDDLVASRTEILVLQMDPVDAPPEPLGKLRGGMTAVCLDVIASGAVGAVLTIPALPDFVATEVAELVWSLVRTVAVDPAAGRPDILLETTYRIRTVVARTSVAFSTFDEQPWLDVMLYLRTAR